MTEKNILKEPQKIKKFDEQGRIYKEIKYQLEP